jgi:hypothetical protein
MMNILIIDNNSDRHKWHKDFWLSEYPNFIVDIKINLADSEIVGLNCDLLVIHGNNKEHAIIEELKSCAFPRVFFSGGWTSTKSYEGNIYYVPQNNLRKLLKDDLIKE